MAETPTHVRLLERNNAWKRGAIPELAPSEGGVGIHAGHKPIDVRVGKTKGGGVSVELQPAVSLRKAAGFLRRRGITLSPLSCVPEETWA